MMLSCATNNVFTIDLEDWFYTDGHYNSLNTRNIKKYRDILGLNTRLLLKMLKQHSIKATFFTLGILAENEKELLAEIIDYGHEIACHGYNHKCVYTLTPDEFRKDIEKAAVAIEKAVGMYPRGFRAPNFSINKKNEWAFLILKELGFIYDSSIQPFGIHPGYGDSSYPLKPFVHVSGIIELPLSCSSFWGLRIPCAGGAYFRHYPYFLFRYLFKRSILQNGFSIFYFHPWELNNDTRPYEVNGIKRYRKYHNSAIAESLLNKLMNEFVFVPMDVLLRNTLKYEN